MPELSSSIQKIDSLKSELDKLLPMKAEDQQRLEKKFRLEWNYNSNHIEGNTLTYGQTELLIMFGKTTGDHDIREYQEMKAHDAALKLVKEYANDKTRHLSEADVRELNKMILVEPYFGIAWTEDGQQTRKLIQPGEYKKEPNSVRLQNGEMFHYASPEETPIKMAELMNWFRKTESEQKLHPIEIAAQLHYDFVRIHPFDDSNGRTSRLLMNYVLLRNGLPPVIIKSVDKKNYLMALNKADAGDLESYIEYIAKELVWSLEVSVKAAKGESIEANDDIDKEIQVWRRGLKSSKVIVKSVDVIEELLKDSIAAIFQEFTDRVLHGFGDIFTDIKINLRFTCCGIEAGNTILNGDSVSSFILSDYLDTIKKHSELNRVVSNSSFEDSIDYLSISYTFDGFENLQGSILNYEYSFKVEFHRYQFMFSTTVSKRGDNKYSVPMTKDDKDFLLTFCLKEVFVFIEAHQP